MKKGILISFEGPDGAGKSTVLEALLPELEQSLPGQVLSTREPGGVAIAERIREVILDVAHQEMDDKTELLLYMAARRQHYVEKVAPALLQGKLVVIDRFVDSSMAYQGYGRGLDKDTIDQLNTYVTDGHAPDMTLYFDVPSEIGLERIAQNADREVNRLDLEKLDMHQRVRQGYQAIAQADKKRVFSIDASKSLEEVIAEARQAINQLLASVEE